MSSSLNNNIYTSIDIRFQNYPSSLIKKAIKRQGFILDELMQREIKTFYPTKEEMPSNDAMINQAANIEKIIQLKASHYEKRRLDCDHYKIRYLCIDLDLYLVLTNNALSLDIAMHAYEHL